MLNIFSQIKQKLSFSSQTKTESESKFITTPVEEFISSNNLSRDHHNVLQDLLTGYMFYGDEIPLVCGGFLRRWVQNEPIDQIKGDIDVYLTGKTNREDFLNYIKNTFGPIEVSEEGFQNHYGTISLCEHTFMIQIMNSFFNITYSPTQIQSHLSSFDSFSSMFCFDFMKQQIIYHENALEHAKNKIYLFNPQARFISPEIQLRRQRKFALEGYSFDAANDLNFCNWICENRNNVGRGDTYGIC